MPNVKATKIPKIVFVFSVLGGLAGLLYGYDSGAISMALPAITKQFSLNATWQGLVVSFMLLGALPAIITATIIEKKVERRNLLIIGGLIFTIGSIGCALSPNINILIFFRFCLGLAAGIANMYSLIYLVEIAPPSIRGFTVSLYQLCVNIGILASYGIGAHFDWRWSLGLGIVPSLIFVIGMICIPASPRWLIRDGQVEKARKILSVLRSSKNEVDNEIKDVQESLKMQDAGLKELFGAYRPALIIVFVLAIFQVFTGINAVVYYAPEVFQGLHMHNSAQIANYVVGFALVSGTFISIFLVDKLGRRVLLMTSFFVQAMPLAIIALFPTNIMLSVVCVFIYAFAFSIGLGPVFWLYVPEVFPLRARALGVGIITFSQYLLNFVFSATFPNILKAIHFNIFYVFAALSLVAVAFTYYAVPETKGKTLEQIESYWRDKSNKKRFTSINR